MKSKLLLTLTAISLIITSCSTTKSLKMVRQNANKMLLTYDLTLDNTIQSIHFIDRLGTSSIPTFEVWKSDRDDFVKMIKDYKDKNEIVRVKSNNAGTGFVIVGTVVGVGGGIYGLFSSSEPKGAAVTSMITGALTALVGSLNLQKKSERANTCGDFLDGILLDFQAYWGVARHPKTKDEFKNYLIAKDEIIERLKSMKCFGLPSTEQ